MRVVVVEDHALLREGLIALLRENDVEVVGQASDALALPGLLEAYRPDLAVLDVRLPPTFSDEGLRAAIAARRQRPELAVLVLSQYVEPVYTAELLASPGTGGLGYLLKERVGDVGGFLDAVRRVAAGGSVLDREVVAEIMKDRRSGATALDALTPREGEVLALMAEGRTNAGIAEALVVSGGAVEKHVTSIFIKLGLPADASDHRRVLAVLAYLRASGN